MTVGLLLKSNFEEYKYYLISELTKNYFLDIGGPIPIKEGGFLLIGGLKPFLFWWKGREEPAYQEHSFKVYWFPLLRG